MFSKTADQNSGPLPSSNGGYGNAARSVLGPDLIITGEIASSGAVEILGQIDGNVTATDLIIGQQGRVTGAVDARSVEVIGQLDGKVSARSFTMRASARVKADVTYASLVIENGAQIEGRFTRTAG